MGNGKANKSMEQGVHSVEQGRTSTGGGGKRRTVMEVISRSVEDQSPLFGNSKREIHRCGGKKGVRSEKLLAKFRLCGTDQVAAPSSRVLHKEPPETEKIAQIASHLASGHDNYDPQLAVAKAMEILQASECARVAVKQQRELVSGVLEWDEAEWEARIQSYEGDLRVLAGHFESTHIEIDYVLRELFRDKSETEDSLWKKCLELIQFAHEEGLPLYSKTGECLEVSRRTALGWMEEEKVDLLTCRWLFVVRQRKIAVLKAKAARGKRR